MFIFPRLCPEKVTQYNCLHNFKKKDNAPSTIIFFVDLEYKNNTNDNFNITSPLNTIRVIEKPHEHRCGPLECFIFQDYGHTHNHYYLLHYCVKCGGAHFSENCIKDRSTSEKCTVYSENHMSNFKRHLVYKFVLSHHRMNFTNFHNTLLIIIIILCPNLLIPSGTNGINVPYTWNSIFDPSQSHFLFKLSSVPFFLLLHQC